jgi:phosphoesterase RecJ-like protein
MSAMIVGHPDADAAHDSVVVVDTAKLSRVNVEGDPEKFVDHNRTVVNIDHHVTNTRFGSTNWIEADASSSCEMVYWLYKQAGWKVTPQIATLLYAGIHTDTAGFSLPTTTPSSLAAAAELVAAGADVAGFGEHMYRSMRSGEFDLLRVFYDNTRVACGGAVACSSATYDEIHGAGCTAADIDDQVGIPRMIAGIRIAMLFTEGDKGKIRINFRGEQGTNVLELAKSFGGGGHATSAGTIIKGEMDAVIENVLARTGDYLASLTAAPARA